MIYQLDFIGRESLQGICRDVPSAEQRMAGSSLAPVPAIPDCLVQPLETFDGAHEVAYRRAANPEVAGQRRGMPPRQVVGLF